MKKFDVPILILAFNRPKYTKALFNKLKELEPTKLYIVCDGPRYDNHNDKILCDQTKEIFENINWPCELKKLYRDINLGCKLSVKDGIDWFFSYEEMGIILEDDCIPNLSFFNFCELMLNKHQLNKEIFQVSGTSYLLNKDNFNGYFHSFISPIWGWATWKDRWREMNLNHININDEKIIKKIEDRYPNKVYQKFIIDLINNVNNFKISSWATYWLYTIIKNDGISILPGKNLIENIGIIGNSFINGKKGNVNKRKTYKLKLNNNVEKIHVNKELDKRQLTLLEKNIINDEKITFNKIIYNKYVHLINKIKNKVLLLSVKFVNIIYIKTHYSLKRKSEKFLVNVFKTNFKKNALVSFTTQSIFVVNHNHTIFQERDTLINIINKKNYNVDLINYDNNYKIDYEKYDLVIGFGYALENAINSKYNCITIFYANGSNPDFSNSLGIKKIISKYNNDLISSVRISDTPYHKSVYLAKNRIILGNDVVKSTYPEAKTNFNLNAFFYKTLDINFKIKDFKSAKKNFLWFGGGGALHKGLDLLLEIFSKRNDISLHICGLTKSEDKFIRYFEDKMKLENIYNYGFVDIKSNVFRELMYKCAFTIMPSISEGGAVSTLTTMGNGGLIPIVSKNTGLDINSFGYLHNNNESEEIENKINFVLSLSEKDIIIKSKACLEGIINAYNFDLYFRNISSILNKII